MSKLPSMPKSIGPYQKHIPSPDSTMEYGTLYERKMSLPFKIEPERMIRVWLPPGYEEGKPYRVIYFSDGQNLVDRSLSAYGDWHLDRVMHQLMEEGYPGVILVGIDCPKNPNQRANELNPPYKPTRIRAPHHPVGNQYVDFIVNVLKKDIDAHFHTLPDMIHTGIGGSSMGGIMAFYAYHVYKEHFGFALAFSIPPFFYSKREWLKILSSWNMDPHSDRKLAMYVGGDGFEAKFKDGDIWLYEYMKGLGFDDHNLHFELNEKLPHHEEAWYQYSFNALRFFLKD